MSETPGRFEQVFEVAVGPDRTWRAFTDAGEIEAWLGGPIAECDVRPGGRVVWDHGEVGQMVWDFSEVEPRHRLVYQERSAILPVPTEVTVTFEASGTGTRLTITQAGFGPGDDWQGNIDDVGLGWAQTLAGMELYLRTGVRLDRFFTFRSDVGAVVREHLAGPEVLSVVPGSFADKAGVRAGDIIVQLGRAPIFTRSDIWMYTREHDAGERTEIVVVRDNALHRSEAPLTAPM